MLKKLFGKKNRNNDYVYGYPPEYGPDYYDNYNNGYNYHRMDNSGINYGYDPRYIQKERIMAEYPMDYDNMPPMPGGPVGNMPPMPGGPEYDMTPVQNELDYNMSSNESYNNVDQMSSSEEFDTHIKMSEQYMEENECENETDNTNMSSGMQDGMPLIENDRYKELVSETFSKNQTVKTPVQSQKSTSNTDQIPVQPQKETANTEKVLQQPTQQQNTIKTQVQKSPLSNIENVPVQQKVVVQSESVLPKQAKKPVINNNISNVQPIDLSSSKENINSNEAMRKYKSQNAKISMEERQKERFVNKASGVASKYIRRMMELKGAPNNMNFFVNVLEDTFVRFKDANKEKNEKTIGTYCVMVPQELIYAAGAMPVKLCCGSYTAFNIGDDFAPRDACPLVKSVVGACEIQTMPIYDNCSLMVVPTTCDCKKKMAYLLQQYKDTVSMHIPSAREADEDLDFYVEDLYKFKNELEIITKKRITYRKLKKSIEMIAKVQYEISRFYELKKAVPALIKGTHAMAIMNSYSYCNANKWKNALKLLNDELEMNLASGKYVGRAKQPRILITGSPIVFPNIKIPLLIEEMGGLLVADETCMGERGLYDPVAVSDDSFDGMMRALAKRYVLPCSCPTFVDNSQRVFKLKQMIDDFQVEGVVYHVLRGCLVYDYEYAIIEEALAEKGIPIIRLESDYNEEDIEQLRIRIEAFIEMIKFGNSKNDREGNL